jgi:hypothetical protein
VRLVAVQLAEHRRDHGARRDVVAVDGGVLGGGAAGDVRRRVQPHPLEQAPLGELETVGVLRGRQAVPHDLGDLRLDGGLQLRQGTELVEGEGERGARRVVAREQEDERLLEDLLLVEPLPRLGVLCLLQTGDEVVAPLGARRGLGDDRGGTPA